MTVAQLSLALLLLLLPSTLAAPSPSAAALQAQINAAIQQELPELTVAAGIYNFSDTPLLIDGAVDFKLTAQDPAILLFDGLSCTGGVVVHAGHNIHISGFTIDYDPAPNFQGTFLTSPTADPSTDACTAYILLDQGFIPPDVFLTRWIGNGRSEFVQGPLYFLQSQNYTGPGYGPTFFTPPDIVVKSFPDNATYVMVVPCHGSGLDLGPGDKITVIARVGHTYLLQNSSHVTTTNVTIRSASFMGFTEFDGVGSHVYLNSRLVRRPPDGARAWGSSSTTPMWACNADAFHSSGVKFGPTLRGVELSYSVDDYVNVHSRLQLVVSVVNSTRIILADPRLALDYGLDDDAPYGTVETMTNARVGDALEFYQLSTIVPQGTFTISSLTRITDPATLAQINATINRLAGTGYPGINPLDVRENRAYIVDFAQQLNASIVPGSISALHGWDARGAQVVNCHFHHGPDGFRWKSSDAVISNNTWTQAAGSTTMEISMLQPWLEGPAVIDNVLISNNYVQGPIADPNFVRVCQGARGFPYRPELAAACSNIRQINNTFVH